MRRGSAPSFEVMRAQLLRPGVDNRGMGKDNISMGRSASHNDSLWAMKIVHVIFINLQIHGGETVKVSPEGVGGYWGYWGSTGENEDTLSFISGRTTKYPHSSWMNPASAFVHLGSMVVTRVRI